MNRNHCRNKYAFLIDYIIGKTNFRGARSKAKIYKEEKITCDLLSYLRDIFNQIQHPVMIKSLEKLGVGRKVPQCDKGYQWEKV